MEVTEVLTNPVSTQSLHKRRSPPQRIINLGLLLVGISVALFFAWKFGGGLLTHFQSERLPGRASGVSQSVVAESPRMSLVAGTKDQLLVPESVAKTLGIRLSPVQSGIPPRPLQLSGRLFIDSTRVARVHSRFPGEIISLATREVTTEKGSEKRPIRYGDSVQQDEVLAVVWSKEVGEKKSELVDALSRLRLNKSVFERLSKLEKGVVSDRMIREAERNFEADQIAVAQAERTLRSWRLDESEIVQVREEAERLHSRQMQPNPELERQWAQVQVRAPFTGVLMEITAAPGVIVDSTEELFKIADLDTLSVIAHVYEDDLPLIEKLAPEQRKWVVEVNGTNTASKLHGEFGLIGEVIDPMQHTASVIGWVPNVERKLRIGQFITATVLLPAQDHELSIPVGALLEDGNHQYIFVAMDASGLRFVRRNVQVLGRNETVIRVREYQSGENNESGVRPTEQVVSEGAVELAGGLVSLLVDANNSVPAAPL